MTQAVKVHAHWITRTGEVEIYLVGKYLYYYTWQALPHFRVGQLVTKAEIGRVIAWKPWNPKWIPVDAYRAIN